MLLVYRMGKNLAMRLAELMDESMEHWKEDWMEECLGILKVMNELGLLDGSEEGAQVGLADG